MAEQPEACAAPPPLGCGARLMLFVPVWLLGSFLSIFGLYAILLAIGPKGPDSAMGSGLGAVMLAPIAGLLFGLAALGWQARFDPQGKRTGPIAATCLALLVLALLFGQGLFV